MLSKLTEWTLIYCVIAKVIFMTNKEWTKYKCMINIFLKIENLKSSHPGELNIRSSLGAHVALIGGILFTVNFQYQYDCFEF